MIPNNNQRFNIWQTLHNRFDYDEMATACSNANVAVMGAHEFANKVGMILCGKVMFPELDEISAYSAFSALHFNQPVAPQPMPTQEDLRRMFPQNYNADGSYRNPVMAPATPCNTCGGGTVR